jgi:hypothetical protein
MRSTDRSRPALLPRALVEGFVGRPVKAGAAGDRLAIARVEKARHGELEVAQQRLDVGHEGVVAGHHHTVHCMSCQSAHATP